MSDYLSREIEIYTKEINARLIDVVGLLINDYSDYDSASEFIDQIAAYVENDMFPEAEHQLDRAERDPAGYFDLPQPTYDKDVLEDDSNDATAGFEERVIKEPPLFWFG